ncbi:MAG: YcnI family protein [Rhodoglobus sp.]
MSKKIMTTKKTVATAAIALAAGATLALAAPLAASAHVSAGASSTAAGSYTIVTMNVPHGCDGSPTMKITIDIPEDIVSVTPTVNPNWTISRTTEPLATAVEDQTERTSQVIYTAIGDGLPADQRDTFELSLRLPDGEAGDVVEFPVTQDCAVGQTLWVGDEVPSITLTAALEGDEHGHGAATEEEGEHGEAETQQLTAAAPADGLARVLGIGGLVLGALGVTFGLIARRKAVK